MNQRQQALQSWLETTCGLKNYQLTPLAGDASFRSYFRLSNSSQSYVVMDASPEKESCEPFVAIANTLRKMGVMTPEIFASHLVEGFLLLSDFGDRLYLKELNEHNVKKLYGRALDTLSILQTCKQVDGWSVPHFTIHFMRKEMDWFKEWFLICYLKIPENQANQLNPFFDWLTTTIGQQPYVFMHRDYHSANLMVLPHDQVGVLDFQDAFIGPITYDLVSLLRDCYIAWPEPLVMELAFSYWERLCQDKIINVSRKDFQFWIDCMSMQRHLKALLTFSRKYVRDGNSHYLQHIPRTLNYLLSVSERYDESKILNIFLKNNVKVNDRCAQ